MTVVGPTLAPAELAGRKLLALFGRAEARDFADVYLLAQRFGKPELLAQARAVDAGVEEGVLADMIGSLRRFTDEEIPIDVDTVRDLRDFFAQWQEELNGDTDEGMH
jgi:Nucleotidyl transferase AbiEii toxin, Type IV TA system